MKRLLPFIVWSLTPILTASATRFSIPDSGVTFDAPEGFTPLTQQEIASKYVSSRAPAFVVGNKHRTTTIACDVKPDFLPPDKLADAKASFEQLFARIIPGLEWKERKIIERQHRKWIYLEMTSQAIDTDIHNMMVVTPFRGGMLIFDFNSTREEFPKMEQALRKSLESISIQARN